MTMKIKSKSSCIYSNLQLLGLSRLMIDLIDKLMYVFEIIF